jgi:hypothetical protein
MPGDRQVIKINQWLRAQLVKDSACGKIVRFELRHLPINAKFGQEIVTIDLRDAEDTSADWIESRAAEINSTANADCEGIAQGTQRYVLLAYRSEDPTAVKARFAFVVAGPDKEESEGFESEPASKSGVVAMLMRHVEAKERVFAQSFGMVLQSVQRMAATLADENEDLRAKRLEAIETTEELLSLRHERELEDKRAQSKIAIMEKTGKEVLALLPAVAARFMGGANASSDSVRDLQLKAFYESLTDNQKEKIASTLEPTQQIALVELVSSANKGKEE